MSFLETVRRARSHLEEQDRVSLRALTREFDLDRDALDELVEELVDVQQVAVREGQILVWVGAARAEPPIAELSSVERAPRDYTPRHLADKILQHKSALEGERKQVTVFFADVKGSMELAEQLDPEEWHGILDRFFEVLTEGVHRFEGTVNQYTGDGIMALFGAPIAHEDHAQRACYAALWLADELRPYTDELRRRGLGFSVRMGVNSGEVIVGRIGDDLRMDYTAQGHVVGTAQRIEQSAAPGSAYIGESTARLVEGFFQLRDLGAFVLKGVSVPLRVYELEGIGASRTRIDVSRARGFSRFVGRGDEMASLEAALRHAAEGNGQVVGIVGEAGVGKSRLCVEFIENRRAEGMPVYEAHCPAHGKTLSLLPIRELLRNAFGVAAGDSDRSARDAIAGRLLVLDEAFRAALPLIFDFVGVPGPEHPAPQIDADARHQQLCSFLRRLVHAWSEREPTVVVIDDLHWIDKRSDAFLAELALAVAGTRILLLVNFRPEYRADWTRKSHYQQLPLSPLGPEAISELLHALLGDDPSVGGLPDLIRERTQGNPFFIEEVVQSLVDGGALQGQKGSYRQVAPIGAIEMPRTVKPVLAGRIDRLPERAKQTLQTASVIGKRFSEALLARVAEADVAAALGELEAAEFIFQEALYPEVEYAFKHPLTQEVAYDSQLAERRKQIHAAVAQTLEELHADGLLAQAALLAHHWERAGHAPEALRWHEQAALAASMDPFEADRHWRRVRALAQSLPASKDAARAQIHACGELLALGLTVGISRDEARSLFVEGTTLASAREDLPGLTLLEISFAHTRGYHNEFPEMLDHARKAAHLAERQGIIVLKVAAAQSVMRPLQWMGRLREAREVCDQSLELVEDNPDLFAGSPRTTAELLHWQGIFLTALGRPSEGLAVHERAIALARKLGIEGESTSFYVDAVVATASLGDAARALDLAHRAVDVAEEYRGAFARGAAQIALMLAKLLNREWADALESVARIRSIIEETQIGHELESLALVGLAEAHLGLGDLAAAREAAEEALTVIPSHGLRMIELRVVGALAQVALAEGESSAAEAEALLERAAQLNEESGRMTTPALSEGRASLARIRGDEGACEQHLREAHRLYAEIGATGHAERVARELES